MIKVKIEEDVKALLKDIQSRVEGQFNVYLGGGALRDSYCDKPIKDLDIFFIPCNSVSKEVGYIPAKWYVNYNKKLSDLTNTSDMASRGVCQVVGLFNGSMSTKEAQFIVYDKHLTIDELAEDFDMNICQIVWCARTGDICATEEFLEGHEEEYIECTQDYDISRTFDRYTRMEAKFPDYDVYDKPEFDDLPIEKRLEVIREGYTGSYDAGSMV